VRSGRCENALFHFFRDRAIDGQAAVDDAMGAQEYRSPGRALALYFHPFPLNQVAEHVPEAFNRVFARTGCVKVVFFISNAFHIKGRFAV
jgi:hypothetical protein